MNQTIMVGRLRCLKEIFSSLASGVYNQDGTPRLDRAFCLAGGHALIPQNLPRFSTKNGLPMTGLGNTIVI